MTHDEHLLVILAEECSEVAQRASKALRFGLGEIEPGQPLTNAERIMHEWSDLLAVMEMLQDLGRLNNSIGRVGIDAKKDKVRTFLAYSDECGTVTP